ncbi:hypothetical protein ACLB1S_11375 [Escherichia coli]
MNSLFASTAVGLEELLKTELENLGAVEIQVVKERSSQGRHTACLPEPDVEPPGLAYYVAAGRV